MQAHIFIISIIAVNLIFPANLFAIAPETAIQKEEAQETISKEFMESSPVIPFEWARAQKIIRNFDPVFAAQLARAVYEKNGAERSRMFQEIRTRSLPKFLTKFQIPEENGAEVVAVLEKISPKKGESLNDTMLGLFVAKMAELIESVSPPAPPPVPPREMAQLPIRAASLGAGQDEEFRETMSQFRRLNQWMVRFRELRKDADRAFKGKGNFTLFKEKTRALIDEVYGERLMEPLSKINLDYEALRTARLEPGNKTALARLMSLADIFEAQAKKQRRALNLKLLKLWRPYLKSLLIGRENPFYRGWQGVKNTWKTRPRLRKYLILTITSPLLFAVIASVRVAYEARQTREREAQETAAREKAEAEREKGEVQNFIRALRTRLSLEPLSEENENELVTEALENGNPEFFENLEAQWILDSYFSGRISIDAMFRRVPLPDDPALRMPFRGRTIQPRANPPLVTRLKGIRGGFQYRGESFPRGALIGLILETHHYLRLRAPDARNIPERLTPGDVRTFYDPIESGEVRVQDLSDHMAQAYGQSLGRAETEEALTPRLYLLNTAIAAVEMASGFEALRPLLTRQEALYRAALPALRAKPEGERREIISALRFALRDNDLFRPLETRPLYDLVAQKALIDLEAPEHVKDEDVRKLVQVLERLDPNLVLFIIASDRSLADLLGKQFPAISKNLKLTLAKALEQKNVKEHVGNFAPSVNQILGNLKREGALVADDGELLEQTVYDTEVLALFDIKEFTFLEDLPTLVLTGLGRLAQEKDKAAHLAKLKDYGIEKEGRLILIDLSRFIDKVVADYRAAIAAGRAA